MAVRFRLYNSKGQVVQEFETYLDMVKFLAKRRRDEKLQKMADDMQQRMNEDNWWNRI